ncbi:MAG: Flp pilus assembly complex ATPase component TadA [Eggerthellaceae bacterium]|nr:Flp pilus assembly complex ATPase component TadA [Eggerthellaceae bacterium]
MRFARLGDLLVDAGVITEEQLMAALKSQKESKRRLGDELIQTGVITERQLIDALMMQLGVDYIDLSTTEIDPEMAQVLSKNIAKKYSVVPVRTRGDELYLAMADPLNFIATEEVRSATHRRVIPLIATQSGVEHAISVLYGTEGAKRAIREMQQETVRDTDYVGTQVSDVADSESAAPSIRLVDSIIERGISGHASDIHIEPQEDVVNIRMRVDGILHNTLTIPKELQQSVTSRVKIMCGMDVTERRVPQDGRAIVRIRMHEADLRTSTLPTVHGEKIVLRILDRDAKQNTAEELGFYGHNLEVYNQLLENSQGVILLVGPTGSGKSSTLFTMIGALNDEGVNIVTLEDPVEYSIVGVNQVQVNEKLGMTFASGLRSILRQDPDIVSVGEIRDNETAEIAMRAAVTGHLVLSTLHTGDAVSTIDRLSDMGIEPYMLAKALKGVISQRLVRRICPHCREEYTPSAEELESVGMNPNAADVKFYRGAGCPECFQSGYRGRIVIAEALVVNKDMRDAIHHQAPREQLMAAVRASGFEPILDNAVDLVLRGITTTEEVRRTIYTTD